MAQKTIGLLMLFFLLAPSYSWAQEKPNVIIVITDQAEVTFKGKMPAGKYDMEAQLIDEDGSLHPACYDYIEKL